MMDSPHRHIPKLSEMVVEDVTCEFYPLSIENSTVCGVYKEFVKDSVPPHLNALYYPNEYKEAAGNSEIGPSALTFGGDTVPYGYNKTALGVYTVSIYELSDTIVIPTRCDIRGHIWESCPRTTLEYYPSTKLVETDSTTIMIHYASYSRECCLRCGQWKETKVSDEVHKVLWRRK